MYIVIAAGRGRLLAAILAFTSSIWASMAFAGAPPICGYDPNAGFKFEGQFEGDLLQLVNATPANLRPTANTTYRVLLSIDEGGIPPSWSVTVESGECARRKAQRLVYKAADIDLMGREIWTPAFCANARIKRAGEGPAVYVKQFGMTHEHRQLGVVDGEQDTPPNWCKISDFADGEAGGAEQYTPGAEGFRRHVNSIVALGFLAGPSLNAELSMLSISGCTGFFVTDSLIMTNRHCICPTATKNPTKLLCPPTDEFRRLTGEGERILEFSNDRNKTVARHWKAWSRAVDPGAATQWEAPTYQNLKVELLGQRPLGLGPNHHPLDYALLRVNRAERPTLEIGPVRLAHELAPVDAQLAIPQYPGNYPYAINYDTNCRVFGDVLEERGDAYVYSPHGCDTAGGSSGSPVFRRDMSEVVGLHACCELPGDSERIRDAINGPSQPGDNKVAVGDFEVNQFVPIQLILCDIQARSPEIFEEIAGAQGWPIVETGGVNAITCDRDGA